MSESEEKIVPITEALERYKPDNKLNYSNVEMAAKERWIRDAKRDYPQLPEQFISWAIDYRKIIGEEKFNEMCVAGEFSKSANPRDTPSVLYTAVVENPELIKK